MAEIEVNSFEKRMMKGSGYNMPDFTDYPWQVSYQTSSIKEDGSSVDILHDFYIPALKRAETYDRVAGYFRSTSLAAASEGYTAFLGRVEKLHQHTTAAIFPPACVTETLTQLCYDCGFTSLSYEKLSHCNAQFPFFNTP